METIYLSHPFDHSSLAIEPTVFALGYFDGVHLGHQYVIEQAVSSANELGVKSAVMTFHPHPKEVLQKLSEPMRFLTPLPDKLKKMAELGVDKAYVVEFNQSFANLLPQEFVDQYLITLGARHVVAGFDFSYGKWGRGTMNTLLDHSRERFTLSVMTKVEKEGMKVSSTALRALLTEGKVEAIPELLGSHYVIEGTIIDGEKRGRSIGFPTANVLLNKRFVIPKTGVYVVEVTINGERLYGMCNVGYKPTFHEKRPDEPSIEVHLLDFDKQIYGETISVTWLHRLRDEKRFNGIEELVQQLHIDKEKTIAYVQGHTTK